MASPTARKLISPYCRLKQEESSNNAAATNFQSRKSLANHVKDNMLCAGRRTYYQRFIFVNRYDESQANTIKEKYLKQIQEAIKSPDEKLTGLIILSSKFTMACIEGPEDIVGRFFKQIANDNFLEVSKIVLIYNNMNQSFFRKIIWRFAELLTSSVEKFPTDIERVEHMTKELVKKIYKLCKFVREEEADESNGFRSSYLLSSDYQSSIPDINHLNDILNSNQLMSLENFAEIYGKLPSHVCYAENVWPVPFDFIPNNVFDW